MRVSSLLCYVCIAVTARNVLSVITFIIWPVAHNE